MSTGELNDVVEDDRNGYRRRTARHSRVCTVTDLDDDDDKLFHTMPQKGCSIAKATSLPDSSSNVHHPQPKRVLPELPCPLPRL